MMPYSETSRYAPLWATSLQACIPPSQAAEVSSSLPTSLPLPAALSRRAPASFAGRRHEQQRDRWSETSALVG